jgi:hypothetical protein
LAVIICTDYLERRPEWGPLYQILETPFRIFFLAFVGHFWGLCGYVRKKTALW